MPGFYNNSHHNPGPGTEPPQGAAQTLMGTEPDPAPRTVEEQRAAAIYDRPEAPPELAQVSDEVAELRRGRFHDAAGMYRTELDPATFTEVLGDPAEGRRVAAEVAHICADMDLGPADVRRLTARVAEVAGVPVESQREGAMTALRAAFGGDAQQALADARLLLERDPRAARLIERLGLADDGEVAVLIAQRARSQIARGVLKRPGKGRG